MFLFTLLQKKKKGLSVSGGDWWSEDRAGVSQWPLAVWSLQRQVEKIKVLTELKQEKRFFLKSLMKVC